MDLSAESQSLLARTNRMGKSSQGTVLTDGVVGPAHFSCNERK